MVKLKRFHFRLPSITFLVKPTSKKFAKKRFPKVLTFLFLSLLIISGAGYYFLKPVFSDLPSPSKLQSHTFPVSTQIFDRNQILLYEIYTDTRRTPVALSDLPSHIPQATIAIEDQAFYEHFGFSFQGMLRATKNTLLKNRLQGGSTITQQLVKTALLEEPERTIKRKLREAVLTIATEIRYSKDEILEMYLNHIPYGGTAYGIEAAAQKYFGKTAQDLNLAEASLLVGLPQAPSRYSPFTNPDAAKARQHEVLRRMVEDGYIDQKVSDQAFAIPLNYTTPTTDIKAPHFVFYVKDLLVDMFGIDKVEKGGLRVITTLDVNIQEMAQASVSAEVGRLASARVSNGAAIVTKPDTGEILAMVGSKNYFNTAEGGQVNVTTRLRQPGSSIKPLNYVTALQLKKMTPASPILDMPTCFTQGSLQAAYCPKNYDNSFHGIVSFRQALANSYNIPAVKILALNSLDSMIATASAMGISTFTQPERYGLSLTLGGGEVTMLDMATAFGTLSNQGVKINVNPFLHISDYTGALLAEYQAEKTEAALSYFFNEDEPLSNELFIEYQGLKRVLNREPAYLTSHILMDNNARIPAFGANSKLVVKGKTVSVKTGTTNDLRDNWTIGYTPQYLVVTWVGNNDNTPMNQAVVSGVTGAAPIWNGIMAQMLKDVDADETVPPKPPGVTGLNVCFSSGTYPVDGVECSGRFEQFWDLALPQQSPISRKEIWVYKDSGVPAFLVNPNPDSPPDPETIELRQHTVFSDGFSQDWCVDCPYPQDEKGRQQYPSTRVDMSKFYLQLTPTKSR
jgi:penicillin-binding protein 1C